MIELKDVMFEYRRKSVLFSALSLQLERGRIYGLLGSNGVGKTTLLKLISGLLIPHEGTITVMGQEPKKRYPSLYRELFFIPEEFEMPAITFKAFVKTTAPFYPHFSHESLAVYCREFEVDLMTHLSTLSMGQKNGR